MRTEVHRLAPLIARYSIARVHTTLSVTPAIEAAINDNVCTLEEIARLAD